MRPITDRAVAGSAARGFGGAIAAGFGSPLIRGASAAVAAASAATWSASDASAAGAGAISVTDTRSAGDPSGTRAAFANTRSIRGSSDFGSPNIDLDSLPVMNPALRIATVAVAFTSKSPRRTSSMLNRVNTAPSG